MTEFVWKDKTYVLTEGDGEEENGCPCNICAFNTMGAEGAQACKEAPLCEGEHYEEKVEVDVSGTFYDDLDKAGLLEKNAEEYRKAIAEDDSNL